MDEPDNERWPDKGLWIYAEFAIKALLLFLVDSGVGFILLLLLWFRYGSWPFLIGGLLIGSLVIWRIVRWVNRRGDRRMRPSAPSPGDPSETS